MFAQNLAQAANCKLVHFKANGMGGEPCRREG